MSTAKKDTIYIDAEDEITSVIDKVVSSKSSIVAVVLPKHATVFQSTINMKLLAKAAKSAKKNVALITNDPSVMAIAGATGMHVAKTPTSKPIVPAVAAAGVAGAATAAAAKKHDDEPEPAKADTPAADESADDAIQLDNSEKAAAATAADASSKKAKTSKIPDFTSFRFKLALGIGLLLLLAVLWYVGFRVLPKATITVTTDTSTAPLNIQAIARTGIEEPILEENVLPAETAQVDKIDSTTVAATGEKNVGAKSTGTLTLTNCIDDGEVKVIAAGTIFSKDSLNFVTSEQIILDPAVFSAGTCRSDDFGLSRDVAAQASEPGANYNVASGSFTSSISGIRAFGSAFTGGTDEIVTVVSEEDVQRATAEVAGKSKSAATAELEQQLRDGGLRAIPESLSEGEPVIEPSPGVGEQASEVKVTVNSSYSMFGISDEDLNALLDAELAERLGDEQKNVRDNGLNSATFQVLAPTSASDTPMIIETVALIGPDLNEQQIAENAAGKTRGEIESELESIDGVRSVDVQYSPAWITTTPNDASKITVIINEEE